MAFGLLHSFAMRYLKGLIILIALVTSPVVNAGWFGPNKADKAKITVESVAEVPGRCPPGFYSFQIRNGSTYKVNKVTFFVSGKIPGRSTEYSLGDDVFNPFTSDVIMNPGASVVSCFELNQRTWPKGEKLLLSAQVAFVDFQNGTSEETVY